MATPGPVNRTLLQSYYQNAGDVYDDTKTEGAFGTLADQMDSNYDYVSGMVAGGVLQPYPFGMNRQAIINGNFDVWQRGSSFSNPANQSYTSDRWSVTYDGTIGTFFVSQQGFPLGFTDVPNNPKYYLNWNQTTPGSGSGFRVIRQKIESVRNFAGQKITLSFWARADIARTINVNLRQSFGSGGSPSSFVDTSAGTFNLTTSFRRFTATVTLPSVSGKTLGTNNDDCLEIMIFLPVNTTMIIDIAQFQLNAGDQALPFQPRSVAEELQLCLRYFRQAGSFDTVGRWSNASQVTFFTGISIPMRTAPTISLNTTAPIAEETGVAIRTGSGSTIIAPASSSNGAAYTITGFTGATGGNFGALRGNYINLDSEL